MSRAKKLTETETVISTGEGKQYVVSTNNFVYRSDYTPEQLEAMEDAFCGGDTIGAIQNFITELNELAIEAENINQEGGQ